VELREIRRRLFGEEREESDSGSDSNDSSCVVALDGVEDSMILEIDINEMMIIFSSFFNLNFAGYSL